MATTSMERLINVNNVKYEKLIPIINEAFIGSKAETIDVYIDMYSLMKVLYTSVPYTIDNYEALTACFINMVAHYRHFFYSRYKVDSRFYLVYSTNTPYLNKQFLPDYNGGNEYKMSTNKKVTDLINANLEILETLCPYLPDIFFIHTQAEAGVCIYDLMCRQDMNNKNGHMVITKDIYLYQLVNMKPSTIILRTKQNDGSYFIDKNTLYSKYCMERKINELSKIISADLFTAILALSGLKERNIKTFLNISKVNNTLESAILDRKILNGYNNDLSFLWYGIVQADWLTGLPTFVNRFKAIDIQFQHTVYTTTPEALSLNTKLVNLHDPDAVKAINNNYFINNPLDLNRL